MIDAHQLRILRAIRDGRPIDPRTDWVELTELVKAGLVEMAKAPNGQASVRGLTLKGLEAAGSPPRPTARPPAKSLYEVTLAGHGPEPVRCTPSDIIELEAHGHTVTEKRRIEGQTCFSAAVEALSKLRRHAELTGNTDMLAKADEALRPLLSGQRFMQGGAPARRSKDRTDPGMGR